nr:glycosyltransferase family 2 protein [candidate division Zixibacteria bacterium]
MEELPKISVIIPIRNEEKYITATLGFILSQDYPADKLEILVVDGESEDRSREIVDEIAGQDHRVRLLNNPGRLSSAGRNVGVRMATGEIVTFIDGHTYIDNNQLLKNMVELMRTHNLEILSRPQFLETPDNNHFQGAVAIARKSLIGHGLDSTIYTADDKFVDPGSSGASYRREIFDKIGYYDEIFDACEDVEFNYRASRAGFKSFTSLKLAVYYYPRESLSGLFRQMKRYGIGRYRLFRKFPGSLSAGTLAPLLLTVGIPSLGICAIFIQPLIYLFMAIVGLYILGILGWSLGAAIRHGIRYFFPILLIYPAIHTGLGFGFILEFFRTIFGKGAPSDR